MDDSKNSVMNIMVRSDGFLIHTRWENGTPDEIIHNSRYKYRHRMHFHTLYSVEICREWEICKGFLGIWWILKLVMACLIRSRKVTYEIWKLRGNSVLFKRIDTNLDTSTNGTYKYTSFYLNRVLVKQAIVIIDGSLLSLFLYLVSLFPRASRFTKSLNQFFFQKEE